MPSFIVYRATRGALAASVTYFDDIGRAFSRENYGQLTPHRTIGLGPDGLAMPHEHMAAFGDRGPIGAFLTELPRGSVAADDAGGQFAR